MVAWRRTFIGVKRTFERIGRATSDMEACFHRARLRQVFIESCLCLEYSSWLPLLIVGCALQRGHALQCCTVKECGSSDISYCVAAEEANGVRYRRET